ncbi:DUF6266 family protein [Daejeonella sp.]|uniref:DUF6266 family protein n=1 Tax=Daejeonella sp. TaxID=2805397 RepID=UPI002730DE34|nr:DUF6266 family protein [Daejeonella sp.]MDP2412489.1 DUF6266 family protein [Daejeonella sp.]
MGTYKKGILGSFSGKVGTVVGSSWNGIEYMRSLPKPSSKAPTDLQMLQRAKMGMATGFLQPISALISIGYKSLANRQTAFNVATSQLLAEAITGTYPDLTIDYPKVLISKGNLTGAWGPAVNSAASKVNVTWQDNSASGTAKPGDKVMLLVYNPEKSQYVFTTDGDNRSTLADSMDLPADFVGDTVHVWIAFISADKKTVSTSLYISEVVIA